MKFALVDERRQEAQPGLSGTCASCSQPVVAKCGEIKCWHWAHQGHQVCDSWFENETEWHRAWKDHFPAGWQEFVHRAGNGEKHIADVRTDRGWVIEFQHSYLKPEERRARNAFYEKLIWVVDATRRKTDGAQLLKAFEEGGQQVGAARRVFSDSCALLREWGDSHGPVFFDFGGGQVLWWLLRGSPGAWTYVVPFSRSNFIESCQGATEKARDFDEFVKTIPEMLRKYESERQIQAMQSVSAPPQGWANRFHLRRRRL